MLATLPTPSIARISERLSSRAVPASWLVLLFIVHAGLALVLRQSTALATLHAVLTLAAGLLLALLCRRPQEVAPVAAYIAGAEILWRACDAQIFWEYGKYALVLLLFVTMVRFRLFRPPLLFLLYFLLLLPSALITMHYLDLGPARVQLSFNLSGHLALLVAAWLFSQLRLSRADFQRIFLGFSAPAAGMAAMAAFTIITSDAVQLGLESNLDTSGGYGPNQVAAILGLAALLMLLFALLNEPRHSVAGLFALGCMLIFIAQSAITFSRSGLYYFAGAALLAVLFLLAERGVLQRIVPLLLLLAATGAFLLLPQLDAYTEGKLSQRFLDTNPTGRDTIVKLDLQIWSEHPMLGVGPGRAMPIREAMGYRAAAHTEFTRMLSEHGMFGLLSLLLLVTAAAGKLLQRQARWQRAVVAALLAWSVLFMSGSAMRLAAPSLLFGLACFQPGRRDIRRPD